MSFYDAIKEVASLAQKADNIELYRQLLDLSVMVIFFLNPMREFAIH